MNAFTRYIAVGPVSVHDLAANHPDIIAGYPMPTAVAGFGYKLGLDISRHVGNLFKVAGTAVVVHAHSELVGHSKNPVETPGKDAAPIIDEFRARAELSFVIALHDIGYDDDGVDPAYLDEAARLLERKVPEWLFGGGKIFPMVGRTAVRVSSHDGLAATLRELPPGFVLVDRHDLMEKRVSEGRDTLDALLDIIEFHDANAGNDGFERLWERRQPGWIVPLCVGFQAIETPRMRKKSRINDGVTPHLYGESIYSVGEYKSLRTLVAVNGDEALEGAFWRHRVNKNSGTYFVSAMQTS